jgi:hypothetical protein
MIRRLAVISLVLLGLVAACGIPDNGGVSRIPDNNLGALNDTIPTTAVPTTVEPTTATLEANTSTTIATEDVTLYFISGGILVPFTGVLRKGATAFEVLSALQQGPPPGVIGIGLRTAVPTADQAPLTVKTDDSGVATVDMPANFYDWMKTDDQRLAIGQIVLTLTDVGRVGQVLFTRLKEPIGVPRGSGDFSEAGQPLPPRDYLDLLQSSVATTTSTTTTTTTTTTTIPVTTTTVA